MAWLDPLLKPVKIPEDIATRRYRLGDTTFQLLPKQYEFLEAKEEFVGYVGGYGSGKTRIGAIKAAYISVFNPNNRGVVAMYAATDLEDTAQRDTLDFLRDAGLLAAEPNARTHRALVKCLDPKTQAPIGYTSEISFLHFDDPTHLRGRHLGWFWMDEGSKAKDKGPWQNLIGRLRLPEFRNQYQGLVTGNPEGHNWIYDFFFNQELLETALCDNKGHAHESVAERNRCIRIRRRGIHCTSYDNIFLPQDYLDNMTSSFTPEERERYINASFDVFIGQIHREWNSDIHVLTRTPWPGDSPPDDWERVLAWDIGGATPHNMLWGAVDPMGNVVFYDEINEATTDVRALAEKALPRMKSPNNRDYKFRFKVLDYENRIAGEDMRRAGILFTDAVKTRKMDSVHRFSGYLHPNPKHHFPDYHPRAGQPGSPRAFFTLKCRTAIKEIPQQRWKNNESGSSMKDEPDRDIRHDAWDCCLYICRLLPDPSKLKPDPGDASKANLGKMSQLYYADLEAHKEQQRLMPERRVYGVSSRW